MSKIITVSREFGSGGRELGKRLADYLHIPCYDKEIIEEVAKLHGLDEHHIEHISNTDIRAIYPATIGRRFIYANPVSMQSIDILVSQQKIIEKLAYQGDCVIVGRCADIILRDMHPLNLFVYASQQAKLSRCIQQARAGENQKEILRQMKRIDKNRASYRELFADTNWGKKEAYHLCINTSDCEIKMLIPALANYANIWFNQTHTQTHTIGGK